jgi:hypothetical protein
VRETSLGVPGYVRFCLRRAGWDRKPRVESCLFSKPSCLPAKLLFGLLRVSFTEVLIYLFRIVNHLGPASHTLPDFLPHRVRSFLWHQLAPTLPSGHVVPKLPAGQKPVAALVWACCQRPPDTGGRLHHQSHLNPGSLHGGSFQQLTALSQASPPLAIWETTRAVLSWSSVVWSRADDS